MEGSPCGRGAAFLSGKPNGPGQPAPEKGPSAPPALLLPPRDSIFQAAPNTAAFGHASATPSQRLAEVTAATTAPPLLRAL